MSESNGAGKKKYSLRLKSVKFDVEKTDGTVVEYTLREMMGDTRDQYRNNNRNRFKQSADGNVQVTDHKGVYTSLLAICVYDENDQLVPAVDIQKWPASMQEDLFKQAAELSGLTKTVADEAKNESPATV